MLKTIRVIHLQAHDTRNFFLNHVTTHRFLYESHCVFGQQPRKKLTDNIFFKINLLYIDDDIRVKLSYCNLNVGYRL